MSRASPSSARYSSTLPLEVSAVLTEYLRTQSAVNAPKPNKYTNQFLSSSLQNAGSLDCVKNRKSVAGNYTLFNKIT